MDAAAAWLLGRIAVLMLLATAAVIGLDAVFNRSRPKAPARYRQRMLSAHDEQTGEPIEGLEVMDVMSGTTALTSRTGSVSLAFLPEGGSLVRLRKLGFASTTMTVPISRNDTATLTVLMQRTGRHLNVSAARPEPTDRPLSA